MKRVWVESKHDINMKHDEDEDMDIERFIINGGGGTMMTTTIMHWMMIMVIKNTLRMAFLPWKLHHRHLL
jgi:hydrogenase maturation factor HypE